MQAISDYWKKMGEKEWECSDVAHETDLQDSCDHKCRLTDPQGKHLSVTSHKKKEKKCENFGECFIVWVGGSKHCSPHDNGPCWSNGFVMNLLTASNLRTSYWQVVTSALTVMTAKFYKVFQTLCKMGKNFEKWKTCIWAMNYYQGSFQAPCCLTWT